MFRSTTPAIAHLSRLMPSCCAALVGVLAGTAEAQPTNVRAWYAQGQVFVVWERPAPPASPTSTVEVYASAAAQVTVANMDKIGQLFFPEYTGARLQQLQPNARLLIPGPAGGTYRLLANEGAFAYTPRAAGNLFFAVVDTGNVVVNAGNSAAAAFAYDPVNQPVRPHPQFSGTTPGGYPYTAYAIWADGSDAYDASRPDVPVLASAEKNGVPHVFTITRPLVAPPAGPLSVLFAHHGGGGEYELFRPGIPARANVSLPLTDGIVVTPDDSFYANVEGVLERSNTSWFGYTPDIDPFTAAVRTNPADTSIVVNFTQRRVHWILDWLQRFDSPHEIDPQRVAMIGHSGGGRGCSHLTRSRPERFCAAVVYTPASDLSKEALGRTNYLIGGWDQNLDTNLVRNGDTLGVTEVMTITTPIAQNGRDFALTQYVWGKRDTEGPASWTTAQRAVLDSVNSSRMGGWVSWDEREHGVEKWDNETDDATDGIAGPWPDIGQWIAPVRTRRASGQYLVDTYRAGQSYPGFFNADADALLAGRQPDPGPGDPNLGDVFGTWGAYFDWDTSTIVETATRWEATLYLTGLSAVSIDNSPYGEIIADVTPRKVAAFVPTGGALVVWSALDATTGDVLQFGQSSAEADGVAVVSALRVPRDPDRVRLKMWAPPCPGDIDGNNSVGLSDIAVIIAQWGQTVTALTAPDLDGSGTVGLGDIAMITSNWGATCP
jgi:hypothetical protein